MAAFVDGGDAACRFCRERAGEHPDYASTIEAENERLREENRAQSYMGNSVSYIYDKMRCYQDQVGFAFAALRHLGWDGEGKDNAEREHRVRRWAENRQAETDDLRAALAHERDVLRESLHVKHCADRAAPCPTREREMAAIKRLEGVLGE